MNFPYTTLPGFSKDTKRPLIPIKLIYKNRQTLPILALIDSGADYSYGRAEIADFLGINLAKIQPQKSFAANGAVFVAYPREVEIEFAGHRFKIGIQFSDQIARAFPVILGQENFFDMVRVVFERYKWNLDIRIV